MTNFDSDAALDALLGAADDAVLNAVHDGLDLTAGREAILRTRTEPEDGGERRCSALTALLSAPDRAAAHVDQRVTGSVADDNALVDELLELLDDALDALFGLRHSMIRSSCYVPTYEPGVLLESLMDGLRNRTVSERFALATLEEAQEHLLQVHHQLLQQSSAAREGLANQVGRLHDRLTEARPLVVRLFADEGECSFLPSSW